MRFAKLTTVVTSNPDFCFVSQVRDGKACELRCSDGRPAAPRYPTDPFSVKISLDPKFAGLKLPTLIGNPIRLCILRRDAVTLFEAELNLGQYELLAFSLINHKGRVHSQDYVMFNPLGHFDVASPTSDFIRYQSGGIYGCRRWVLRADRLTDVPDILRPTEIPTTYLVSERLIELTVKHGFTNFEFEPLEIV